jgi:hypothetical protein
MHRTEHPYQLEYINLTIKINNLPNKTELYKIYNHIYTAKDKNPKNMKECKNRGPCKTIQRYVS